MSNLIRESFSKYTNSIKNFNDFHNNVINMPRANFSELTNTIKLLKSLACYILLIDEAHLKKPMSYKEIYAHIHMNYMLQKYPDKYRNYEFEQTFLNICGTIDEIYEIYGRLFRHYMEYFAFFNIFKEQISRKQKLLDIDALEELALSKEDVLFDLFRNKMLDLNVKNNIFINNLGGIEKIKNECDYNPTRAIIKYCKEMKRPVTDFEVSILLGRIDNVQKHDLILERAINIGKLLPTTYEEQIKFFFNEMGWKNGNQIYQYAQSQAPNFKFKVFLIFMNTFGLINYTDTTHTLVLTEYSMSLVDSEIDVGLIDLQKLLASIDDDTEDSNKLTNIIIKKRTPLITKAIEEDGELVTKLNLRNIRNPIIKNGKRMRNKVIAEIAKIKAKYLDEVTQSATFEGKNGNNYVEAHHIIEFNGEDGPDVTENLICLGPQNHSLIHHGSTIAVEDFYKTCITRGVFSFNRFKNICVKYKCLTKKHVDILLAKKIISNIDADELKKLIDFYGVDPIFAASLCVPTSDDKNDDDDN